jgi:hypothetical protein
MGYRSAVTVLIYPDNGEQNAERYDMLKVLMNTTFKKIYEEFESNFEWLDRHRVLKFAVESVKWYDSYPDVRDFQSMLDDLGEMEGLNYEFMRVGEDYDDIEQNQRGNDLQYHISVSRSIEVDL